VSPQFAHELYDIFVRELGALEGKRFDFCWQYDEMRFPKIVLFCGTKKRALYLRSEGLGRVTLCTDLQKQDAANQAIQNLQNHLARISPLARIAWFEERTVRRA
jgi:hypothetical protein